MKKDLTKEEKIRGVLALGGLLILFVWLLSIATPTQTPAQQAPTAPISEEAKFDNWVQNQFSAWDGSVPALVDAVKQNLNDPSSFQHVETKYYENKTKETLVVVMTYRAKNAFGGLILQNITASIDYKTNAIKVLAENT